MLCASAAAVQLQIFPAEVFGSEHPIHDIGWDLGVPAKLQEKWGVPRCFLWGDTVSKSNGFKVLTIVLLLIILKKPIFITSCNDCYSNFILAL